MDAALRSLQEENERLTEDLFAVRSAAESTRARADAERGHFEALLSQLQRRLQAAEASVHERDRELAQLRALTDGHDAQRAEADAALAAARREGKRRWLTLKRASEGEVAALEARVRALRKELARREAEAAELRKEAAAASAAANAAIVASASPRAAPPAPASPHVGLRDGRVVVIAPGGASTPIAAFVGGRP